MRHILLNISIRANMAWLVRGRYRFQFSRIAQPTLFSCMKGRQRQQCHRSTLLPGSLLRQEMRVNEGRCKNLKWTLAKHFAPRSIRWISTGEKSSVSCPCQKKLGDHELFRVCGGRLRQRRARPFERRIDRSLSFSRAIFGAYGYFCEAAPAGHIPSSGISP
jgi:hypothetical protein